MENKSEKKSYAISKTFSFVFEEKSSNNQKKSEKNNQENKNTTLKKNFEKANDKKKEEKEIFYDISIQLDNIPHKFQKEKIEIKKLMNFKSKNRKRKFWKIKDKKKTDLNKNFIPGLKYKTNNYSNTEKTLKKDNLSNKLLLSKILKQDFERKIKYSSIKKNYLKKGKSIFFKKKNKEFKFYLFNEDYGKLEGDFKLKKKLRNVNDGEDEDCETDEELLKKAINHSFKLLSKSFNSEIQENKFKEKRGFEKRHTFGFCSRNKKF